ncbi:hypothetical protein IG197_27585 [Aminobacter sp. SR38]|jgi:hypothetical protein|uniref:hypothetical protein n=1 Tax=Aminobacter sp. SR38 TaxID=2774562 RepID=UPI001780E5D0|nr:hypothetical protein [Aminobacter sp. SR38]QOF71460.1 hypothetical protein IG197_27585 [Aminobacter sp. SR38]
MTKQIEFDEHGNAKLDWDKIRSKPYADAILPPDWDPQIRTLNFNGLQLFAVHQSTGDLYWNGQRLETTKRFSTFERGLAAAGLAAAWALVVIEFGRSARWWP